MKLLSSTRNKIILLLLISVLVFIGWQAGMEIAYARVLVATSNVGLSIVKKHTKIKLEETNGKYEFQAHVLINGKRAHYPQETGSIMQPFVIILSWQIFLFLALQWKKALKSFGVNVVIFVLVQMIFLILLTGYYDSTAQQLFYDIMLDSFYVVAVVLIIKDNLLYPVFRKSAR